MIVWRRWNCKSSINYAFDSWMMKSGTNFMFSEWGNLLIFLRLAIVPTRLQIIVKFHFCCTCIRMNFSRGDTIFPNLYLKLQILVYYLHNTIQYSQQLRRCQKWRQAWNQKIVCLPSLILVNESLVCSTAVDFCERRSWCVQQFYFIQTNKERTLVAERW